MGPSMVHKHFSNLEELGRRVEILYESMSRNLGEALAQLTHRPFCLLYLYLTLTGLLWT